MLLPGLAPETFRLRRGACGLGLGLFLGIVATGRLGLSRGGGGGGGGGIVLCCFAHNNYCSRVFFFGGVCLKHLLFCKDRTRAGRQTIKRLSTNCLQENEHNFAAD
jgi:hypothetical protein